MRGSPPSRATWCKPQGSSNSPSRTRTRTPSWCSFLTTRGTRTGTASTGSCLVRRAGPRPPRWSARPGRAALAEPAARRGSAEQPARGGVIGSGGRAGGGGVAAGGGTTAAGGSRAGAGGTGGSGGATATGRGGAAGISASGGSGGSSGGAGAAVASGGNGGAAGTPSNGVAGNGGAAGNASDQSNSGCACSLGDKTGSNAPGTLAFVLGLGVVMAGRRRRRRALMTTGLRDSAPRPDSWMALGLRGPFHLARIAQRATAASCRHSWAAGPNRSGESRRSSSSRGPALATSLRWAARSAAFRMLPT